MEEKHLQGQQRMWMKAHSDADFGRGGFIWSTTSLLHTCKSPPAHIHNKEPLLTHNTRVDAAVSAGEQDQVSWEAATPQSDPWRESHVVWRAEINMFLKYIFLWNRAAAGTWSLLTVFMFSLYEVNQNPMILGLIVAVVSELRGCLCTNK